MQLKLLKSKLHRARVTDTKLHYAGSVAIADITNGARLETYVVPAERGSKDVIIMGAAVKLIDKGDTVIIFSFANFTPEEVKDHKPQVVALDENNNIVKRI